ncbi:hypothetical protein [Myceligenerans indicum]|uniref:Uncharacterized protein n=1 Tax=Myceligenerans indicum TaxID=2593663 RepID=A0ABS1LGF9_9MICO|nr:hypothetical protein [Myceligenerans indicum]MBL0885310.1 hypothetical protein [Myceligenerans indicum]
MSESYEAASGDDGWDVPEEAFAGAPVAGGGQADAAGAAGRASEPVVEQALSVLDGLDELAPAEHVARYEHVHEALRAHLSGDA